jgi:hypothetical protein
VQELNKRTPHMDANTRHQLVNRLLKMGRIEMHKLGNDILFKVVSDEAALKRVAGWLYVSFMLNMCRCECRRTTRT